MSDTKVKHSVKVDDIFYSSWGYDQSNIDWYQVVKVTPASVYVRKVRSALSDDGRNVVPVINGFTSDRKPELHRVQSYTDRDGSEHVWLHWTSFASLSPWDGTPRYDTLAAGDCGH
jgi:hypothetical protein